MGARFKEKFGKSHEEENEILIDEDEDDVDDGIKFKRKSMYKSRRKWYLYLPLFIMFLICLTVLLIFLLKSKSVDNYDPTLSDYKKVSIYEKMIDSLRKRQIDSCAGYCRRPETQHVDCGRILKGDKNYLLTVSGLNRIPLIENPSLNMSCSAISSRIQPANFQLDPLKYGGVAFIRIVFTDYEFIEKQIQMTWHPENVFCFAVDSKSTEAFKMKMKKLTGCYANMILLPVDQYFDSKGHNQNSAQRKCMEKLLRFPNWKYLLILQNHDLITKTVYELSTIYHLLDGANDVNIGKEVDQRRVPGLKWDPKSLKLFRNESAIPENLLKTPMKIASGYTEASLSRAAVEWLIETVDLTIFINQFNMTNYAGDEQLIPSFQINSDYGMPGHFTDDCFKFGYGHSQVTRFSQWASGDVNRCNSRTVRHGICLIGIEDLKAVSDSPFIMFNKVMPSFDYSIIECTSELLFNRTFLGQGKSALDEEYYQNMVTVMYHKHHNDSKFKLNCAPNHKPWNYQDYLI